MVRHRLLYSCGLNPGIKDEDEMLIDVKTLEGCIREKDKPEGAIWYILTGERRAGGGYVSSKVPVNKLHERFIELINSTDGKINLAINKLMKEYGFKPLCYYPGQYPHRYSVQV